MSLPLAYFLTWHTYGTWLHGDDSGSVDTEHNAFSTPRLRADSNRFQIARRAMKDPPLILSHTARILVDNIMREHCQLRAWDLRALAIRSNHVHAVIANPTIAPEPIVKQLKEWATRKLRSHNTVAPRQRVWADHASTLYLYTPESLAEKTHYVTDMQDDVPDHRARKDWDTKLA
jgi:REP element-mobilizing transposase RayT